MSENSIFNHHFSHLNVYLRAVLHLSIIVTVYRYLDSVFFCSFVHIFFVRLSFWINSFSLLSVCLSIWLKWVDSFFLFVVLVSTRINYFTLLWSICRWTSRKVRTVSLFVSVFRNQNQIRKRFVRLPQNVSLHSDEGSPSSQSEF